MQDVSNSDPDLTPDEIAAHLFATQLQTRIATVPLPYPDGDEAAALASLVTLFDSYRDIVADNPGCKGFSDTTLPVLNGPLRSFSARWHRKQLSGELATRDGAVLFRAELRDLQAKLQRLTDTLTGIPAMPAMEVFEVPDLSAVAGRSAAVQTGQPLAYGITERDEMDAGMRKAINASEGAELRARRGINAQAPLVDATGLALSGGGIRSASFSLGAAQVLAHRGLLTRFDLLSTVSGGGYTGAFLTRTLERKMGDQAAVSAPDGPDTAAIQHLRRRAAFLRQGGLVKTVQAATGLLLGMLVNWTAPLALISLLALLAMLVVRCLPEGAAGWLPPITFGLAGLTLLFHAIGLRWCRDRMRKLSIGAGAAAMAGVAAYLIPLLYGVFLERTGDGANELWPALTVLLAAVMPTLSRILPALGAEWVRRLGNMVALGLASVAVPLLGLYLGFVLYHLGGRESVPLWEGAALPGFVLLIGLAAVLAGIALGLLNINRTGPFSFYRQQLAQSFLTHDGVDMNTALDRLDPKGHAPYLLVNAVANLPSSRTISLRERKGDFFLFSKHWSGSPVLGYHPSQNWFLGRAPMDLASAVAVSGAAVAPHMALLTIGPVRALMSFLNLRLGLWLHHPGASGSAGKGKVPRARILLREMFGHRMSEEEDWVNVSDGGHLENSAVYELLRRRCRFIVAVDASADPRGEFDTLMTLVRHARIDLGVEIRCDLDDLRADVETGLSPAHGILAEVIYPEHQGDDAPRCLMLVVKLSMTGNEPELIQAYRRRNPAFPNQPTSDQFYDEHQFEAYRSLGAHAMDSLFQDVLLGGKDVPPPTDIGQWLTALHGTIPPGEIRQ